MTDPGLPALDPARIIKTLIRHRVEFVLVGGLAGQVRGATRLTADVDICPRWTPENLDRLSAALSELNARIKIEEGSIETLEVALDAKTIANMEIGTWRTSAGDVDVLLGIPRTTRVDLARYEQLAADASVLEVGGERVAVASLDDIVRSKKVSARPKDREALAELHELQAREAERERNPSRSSEPPALSYRSPIGHSTTSSGHTRRALTVAYRVARSLREVVARGHGGRRNQPGMAAT